MAQQGGHQRKPPSDGTGQGATGPAGDAERLAHLERRLAEMDRDRRPATPGADKFHQANQAWRMVVELVAGLAIGFGIGFGLDRLLGTTPILLVIFVFLGFAAGVKTMLRTAAEMGQAPPGGSTATDSAGGATEQAPGDDPDGDKRG